MWPWYWCSSNSCFHVNVTITSLLVWQLFPCECYHKIISVSTDFRLCWAHKSSWRTSFLIIKATRNGTQRRFAPTRQPLLRCWGWSSAPVFPKNITKVPFFVDNNVTNRFSVGARRHREGAGKSCAWWMKWHNGSIRFVQEEKDDTKWRSWQQGLEYWIW